ncbi:MAG: TolC family protein, partial [Muribaculaceae bacterium]|nr:TolC family protein [Muribaculaceae bacterium]
MSKLPSQWQYVPEHMQSAPSDDAWWKQYDDSMLNALISKAESNNYNVASALKRIEIAKRQITAAQSSIYPVVDVSAGWNAAKSAGATNRPGTASHSSSYFILGASVNWEIDVFGRVAAKTKAAKAGVKVSRAEYDGVIVTLCANVAKAYFQLRTYQEQYRVAQAHITSQQEIVRMTQARFDADLGNAFEVSQAKTVLYSTQASIPSLESAIRTTANSIAILIGEYPSDIVDELIAPTPLPPAPPLL